MAMNPKLLRPRATGFNPKSISGLRLWLDASDTATITLNGSNVSEWRDKSGYGSPAASQSSAASQPAYSSSAVNGKSAIAFDSAESLTFSASTGSFNYLHNASGSTVFFVVRWDATQNPAAPRWLLNNTNNSSGNIGISLWMNDSGANNNALSYYVSKGAGGQQVAFFTPQNFYTDVSAYSVTALVCDTANATASARLRAYHNGSLNAAVNTASNSPVASNASLVLTIGNFGGGNACAFVAEVLFYEGALTDSLRSRAERYLGAKYGIAVT